MARLPVVGSDNNTWGNVLNEFLLVEHNNDGTLKTGSGTTLGAYAPLASPTFTGSVTVPSPTNATDAVTKAYVDSAVGAGSYVSKAGDTMTGALVVDQTDNGYIKLDSTAGVSYSVIDAATGPNMSMTNFLGLPLFSISDGAATGTKTGLLSYGSVNNTLRIVNAAAPTANDDIATKGYVDNRGLKLLSSTNTPVVANTTASTTLVTQPITAGQLKPGDVIEAKLAGTILNTSGANSDWQLRLLIGATLGLVGTITIGNAANRRRWNASVEIVIGSSLSSQTSSGQIFLSTGVNTANWQPSQSPTPFVGSNTTTADMSGAHNIVFSTTWTVVGTGTVDCTMESANFKLHRA